MTKTFTQNKRFLFWAVFGPVRGRSWAGLGRVWADCGCCSTGLGPIWVDLGPKSKISVPRGGYNPQTSSTLRIPHEYLLYRVSPAKIIHL